MTVDRLRGALTARAGDRSRAERVTGGNYRVLGKVRIVQASEVAEGTCDVVFPLEFVVEPSFSGGGVLEEGQVPESGSIPKFDVGVLSWEYIEREGGTRIYRGARLAVVGSGPATGMVWHAHYQMEGPALTNPIASTP